MKNVKHPIYKQDNDKAPGEKQGKEEKSTTLDLKDKKIGADPEKKREELLKDTS